MKILKPVYDIFLWSSGADLDILEQVPTEKNKYYGIGGTIFFTACMATFAGGYAFFTAFDSTILSIFFGLFWGALIFNLDRYIVSTFGVGDGKRTISRQELIEAFPRILLAVVLGFVIATPLELKIFDPEISVKIEELKRNKADQQRESDSEFFERRDDLKRRQVELEHRIDSLNKSKADQINNAVARVEIKLKEYQAELSRKNQELERKQNEVNTAYWRYQNALSDSTGSVSKSDTDGLLRRYKALGNERNAIRNDRDELNGLVGKYEQNEEAVLEEERAMILGVIKRYQGELSQIDEELVRVNNEANDKENQYQNTVDDYDGFAAHLEALDMVTDENTTVWIANLMITLLFIFIEIAPILFKMMTERGPYDDILDQKKYEIEVAEKLKKSNLNQDINTQIQINTSKNEQKLAAELLANEKMLTAIALAQAEIASKAIEVWKNQQLKEVEKDVSKIISSNKTSNPV